MKKFNKFQRGSGAYKCISCGKLTRDTGHDEGNLELCRDCKEEAEMENAHSDGYHITMPDPNCHICSLDEKNHNEGLHKEGFHPDCFSCRCEKSALTLGQDDTTITLEDDNSNSVPVSNQGEILMPTKPANTVETSPAVEKEVQEALNPMRTPKKSSRKRTSAKKETAEKTPAKTPSKNGKAPKVKAEKKETPKKEEKTETKVKADKTGLRKPQIRILKALKDSNEALSRKDLAKKAPVDAATCVEYVGSDKQEIREANDKKHFPSLISLGLVKLGPPEVSGAITYTLTAKGKTEAEKLS